MRWLAKAPANIALIKYMGKKEEHVNVPANASLSYTLNNLLSTVCLQTLPGKQDIWEPLVSTGGVEFQLSQAGQQRFIGHLARIKADFNYEGGFLIQSTNNFPQGSGLASSASSFAALTQCAVHALSELTQTALPTVEEQAQLSRLGSGSSCRSFYSPWALWEENTVRAVKLPYEELIHQVIIINGQEKAISSSEAHRRVKTSPDYASRCLRAERRLEALLLAFNQKNWPQIYQICWQEFQDMHQLFSSCTDPFHYMTEDSINMLKILEELWEKNGDGPIVTMDAGPNIHLLYRPSQADLAQQIKSDYLVGNYDVL